MAPRTVAPLLAADQRPEAPADGEYTWRGIWNDDGSQVLREGWVPVDLENSRDSLLTYWDEVDQIEAARAEDEAAEALKRAQQADGTAESVTALARLGETVADHDSRIETLEASTPASEESVLNAMRDFARLANVHQTARAVMDEVIGVANTRAEEIRKVGSVATEMLARITTQVAEKLSWVDRRVEEIQADADAKVMSAINRRVMKLQSDAEKMRGPKGATGAFGSGYSVIAGVPRDEQATLEPMGRVAIKGDTLKNSLSEGQEEYRWDGTRWQRGSNSRSFILTQNAFHGTIGAVNETFQTVTNVQPSEQKDGALPLLSDRPLPTGATPAFEAFDLMPDGAPAGDVVGFTFVLEAKDGADLLRTTATVTRGPGNAPIWSDYDCFTEGNGSNWLGVLAYDFQPATRLANAGTGVKPSTGLQIRVSGIPTGATLSGWALPVRRKP